MDDRTDVVRCAIWRGVGNCRAQWVGQVVVTQAAGWIIVPRIGTDSSDGTSLFRSESARHCPDPGDGVAGAGTGVSVYRGRDGFDGAVSAPESRLVEPGRRSGYGA